MALLELACVPHLAVTADGVTLGGYKVVGVEVEGRPPAQTHSPSERTVEKFIFDVVDQSADVILAHFWARLSGRLKPQVDGPISYAAHIATGNRDFSKSLFMGVPLQTPGVAPTPDELMPGVVYALSRGRPNIYGQLAIGLAVVDLGGHPMMTEEEAVLTMTGPGGDLLVGTAAQMALAYESPAFRPIAPDYISLRKS